MKPGQDAALLRIAVDLDGTLSTAVPIHPDRGAPIHLVRATLGHSSGATTGRYLHARPTESSARFLAA